MSIHVTVNGNPVYLNQRKFLLTDIENVKKNEWLRRRKIRLQQARQQAKDLTQNIRKKVSCERSAEESYEREKNVNEQSKKRREEIKFLQNEFEQCLSSVGSGHQCATLQSECDALLKQKQLLRDEVARARGAIAEEKLRAEKCLQKEKALSSSGRKNLVRKVEDLRSALVSNIPTSAKSTTTMKAQVHCSTDESNHHVQKPAKKHYETKIFPKDKQKSHSENESKQSQRKKSTFSDCEDEICEESDDDSDVTWPPRSARVVKEPIPLPRVRFYDHSTRISKECPKPPHVVTFADPFSQPDMGEAIAEEEEAVVRKENLDILARRERMIRGCKALRRERGKKEAEKIMKEIDGLEKRRRIQIALNRSFPMQSHVREEWRGNVTALSDDEITSSQPGLYENMSVRNDVLPSTTHYCETKTSDEVQIDSENELPCQVSGEQLDIVDSEELLEDLIRRLKEERTKKHLELEKKFAVEDLKETDIPPWLPKASRKHDDHLEKSGHTPSILKPKKHFPERRQLQRSPEKEKRPLKKMQENLKSVQTQKSSPPTKCGCSSVCNCLRRKENPSLIEQNTVLPQPSIHNIDKTETRPEHGNYQNPENINGVTDAMFKENDEQLQKDESNSPPVVGNTNLEVVTSTSNSVSSDTVESSLTYEGVKVVVKVCEKTKTRRTKSPIKTPKKDADVQTSLQNSSSKSATWNSHFSSEGVSSSTSYLSPPSRLSLAQQSLIRSVLKTIESRTKNPNLLTYINRLLSMSRESVENLPVSSVSDISISSSIFDRSENISKKKTQCKLDFCCQTGNSFDENSSQEEALKFSELARCYADRVNDLAGMIDALRILPSHERSVDDDTSYLSPPDRVNDSFKISDSIVPGIYPRPADLSDIPVSIEPHPSHMQPHSQLQNGFQRKVRETVPCDLSTIQEIDTVYEGEEALEQRPFDPDISSIKGTPQKRNIGGTSTSSTRSSLCLLDEREISSFLGSSSDNFEDVFKSLGIAWALPTVRKTRESRKRSGDSSTSSGHMMYSHSTPLGQSPAKDSSLPRGSSFSRRETTSKNNKLNTDSLTPPSFTLNIPRLSPNSSLHLEKNSK